MKTWRLVGVGALCAAFAWGCDERPTNPDMSAPMGERSAASGESLRQEELSRTQDDVANPAEVPGARQARRNAEDVRPAQAEQPAGPQGTQARAQPAEEAQEARQQQAQPGQQAQAPSPEESRAVRDEQTTVIVPGDGLSQEVVQDAERATEEARGATSDERIAVANVEFEGRLQRVGNGRVVVRDGEGNEYEAQLEEDSRVLRSQRQVAVNQLRAGAEVRASFDLVEGDFVVKELEQLSGRRQGRSGSGR